MSFSTPYTPFETQKESYVHHLIQNLVVTDKLTPLTKTMMEENNINHILAILPQKNQYLALNKDIPNVPFHVMDYGEGHDMSINLEKYNDCCRQIEEKARKNENVLVFCNNGFQRSTPFLAYYLIKHQNNEISNIEKAVDVIIPIIDQDNYVTQREMYVNNLKLLLPKSMH